MHLQHECGGHRNARERNHPHKIITMRFNDPHGTISINNTQHIVDKT